MSFAVSENFEPVFRSFDTDTIINHATKKAIRLVVGKLQLSN